MSFWYDRAKAYVAKGNLAMELDSLRAIIVMSGTTADVDVTAEFIADITTLDEYDGTNNARKILTTPVVIEQLGPPSRAYFDSDSPVWAALGDGTTEAVGMIIFKLVNDDLDSVLLAYIDDSTVFPFQGNDQNITIGPSAAVGEEGWLDFE